MLSTFVVSKVLNSPTLAQTPSLDKRDSDLGASPKSGNTHSEKHQLGLFVHRREKLD